MGWQHLCSHYVCSVLILFAVANLLVNLYRCLTFMLFSHFQCFHLPAQLCRCPQFWVLSQVRVVPPQWHNTTLRAGLSVIFLPMTSTLGGPYSPLLSVHCCLTNFIPRRIHLTDVLHHCVSPCNPWSSSFPLSSWYPV